MHVWRLEDQSHIFVFILNAWAWMCALRVDKHGYPNPVWKAPIFVLSIGIINAYPSTLWWWKTMCCECSHCSIPWVPLPSAECRLCVVWGVLGVGAAQTGEGGTGLKEAPLCLRRLLTSQNRKFNQAPWCSSVVWLRHGIWICACRHFEDSPALWRTVTLHLVNMCVSVCLGPVQTQLDFQSVLGFI